MFFFFFLKKKKKKTTMMRVTRASWCTLASTIVGRVRGKRRPMFAAGDRCASSRWTASRSSADAGYFRLAFASGSRTTLEGLDSCLKGAERGYRRAGQVVATFRLGPQDTRAWYQHGGKDSVERLIKLALETAVAKDQCARLREWDRRI